MISIGNTIKTLRKAKGVTQEEVARELGVSYQAVSKYENEVAQPDISLIPLLAQYFGVTIDELFGYKLDALTNKEKFVRFMADNQILLFQEIGEYFINTENFSTNAQISKIGEADYFSVGTIGAEQLLDYARRRGMEAETVKKIIPNNV